MPDRPVLMEMPRTPYFNNMADIIGNDESDRTTGVDYWNIILNPDFPM